MATTMDETTTIGCDAAGAPGAETAAAAVARKVPSDILYCDVCKKACGTVLDAGFDPRLHGMPVRHAECDRREGAGAQ